MLSAHTPSDSNQTFGDVEVEEVKVKQGLHTSSNNGDPVVEPFSVKSPDPVDNV